MRWPRARMTETGPYASQGRREERRPRVNETQCLENVNKTTTTVRIIALVPLALYDDFRGRLRCPDDSDIKLNLSARYCNVYYRQLSLKALYIIIPISRIYNHVWLLSNGRVFRFHRPERITETHTIMVNILFVQIVLNSYILLLMNLL